MFTRVVDSGTIEKIFNVIKRSYSITSKEVASIFGIEHNVYLMFVHPKIAEKIAEYNENAPSKKDVIMTEFVDYCPSCKSVYPPYEFRFCPKCGVELEHVIRYFKIGYREPVLKVQDIEIVFSQE